MAQESPRLIEEPLGEYVEPFRGALLSPDGKLIAQVIGEELRVYDGVTALSQRRPLFTTEHVHTDSLQSNMAAVSFSADGKLIAFPSRRGVEVLDTQTGKPPGSRLEGACLAVGSFRRMGKLPINNIPSIWGGRR